MNAQLHVCTCLIEITKLLLADQPSTLYYTLLLGAMCIKSQDERETKCTKQYILVSKNKLTLVLITVSYFLHKLFTYKLHASRQVLTWFLVDSLWLLRIMAALLQAAETRTGPGDMVRLSLGWSWCWRRRELEVGFVAAGGRGVDVVAWIGVAVFLTGRWNWAHLISYYLLYCSTTSAARELVTELDWNF